MVLGGFTQRNSLSGKIREKTMLPITKSTVLLQNCNAMQFSALENVEIAILEKQSLEDIVSKRQVSKFYHFSGGDFFFMIHKAALMLEEYRRNYGAIAQRSNKESLEMCH